MVIFGGLLAVAHRLHGVGGELYRTLWRDCGRRASEADAETPEPPE